jgi:hypothetical protein
VPIDLSTVSKTSYQQLLYLDHGVVVGHAVGLELEDQLLHGPEAYALLLSRSERAARDRCRNA